MFCSSRFWIRLRIIAFIIFCFSYSSCENPSNKQNPEESPILPIDTPIGGVPDIVEQSIIPGECLRTPVLLYNDNTFSDEFTIGGMVDMGYLDPDILPADIDYHSRVFRFFLKMDLDVAKDTLKMYDTFCTNFRYVPSSTIYQEFGENKDSIGDEYEEVYNSTDFVYPSYSCIYATILYKRNTLSIRANHIFAGTPAHEDFGSKVYVGIFSPHQQLPVTGIRYEEDYVALGYRIFIIIPVEDHQITNEAVSMTLEMPVKVGMYLHWLNDRISNPDAEMQYQDETLTCKFTIHKGLH
ncbi:MAG: hypothetical protein II143_02250 [Bacteroidales bacterium]|nr:hypothetical protein [Bacteroidales bacterium]